MRSPRVYRSATWVVARVAACEQSRASTYSLYSNCEHTIVLIKYSSRTCFWCMFDFFILYT
jgi:hypothetical protein